MISDPEHHIKDNPEIAQQKGTTLYTGWYYVVDSGKGIKRQLDKSKEIYFIDRHPIVTPINLSIEENNVGGAEYYRLFMQLDGPGSKLWAVATKKAIGKQLAFILDNRLLYVAPVFAQILNGMTVINRTNYSNEEFENFKTIIKSER
ncbi:SecDF P1 head subdomain-containing protein [Pedobacter sp. NJ-S-72]